MLINANILAGEWHMRKKWIVFIKSTAVSGLCVLLVSALLAGMLTADWRINRAFSSTDPQIANYDDTEQKLEFQIWGQTYILDIGAVRQAIQAGGRGTAAVCPDLYLTARGIQALFGWLALAA